MSKLPEGWQATRLRFVATRRFSNVDKVSVEGEEPVRLCNYTDVYNNEHIHSTLKFMVASATNAEIDRFRLSLGDVLITKDSEEWDDIAVPSCVVYAADDLVCGYHLALLRPKPGVLEGGYLLRALQASGIREQLHLSATGVTRFGLGQQAIGDALIPVPPACVQRTIANFLDRKTAAIDALIAKKERLIELLQEKRQALITQAVTKGLDPNVPMKDSGIEWLGKVPVGWEVRPLRRVLRGIEQGWSPVAEDRVAEGDEWAVLKLSAVSRGRFRFHEHKALSHGTVPERRFEIRRGDLLLTRANTPELVGDACYVADTPPRLMLPDLIYRLHLESRVIDARFLAHCLLSRPARGQVQADARGSSMSMAKIAGSQIRSWLVPVPGTLQEQIAIAEHLDRISIRLDELKRAVTIQIEKLREYRQALITAAVTGQLDIAEATAA